MQKAIGSIGIGMSSRSNGYGLFIRLLVLVEVVYFVWIDGGELEMG